MKQENPKEEYNLNKIQLEEEFYDHLENYLSLRSNYVKNEKLVSRFKKIKPFLVYKIVGNFGYIQNYESVCKYSQRSTQTFMEFFSVHLGCKLQIVDNAIKTYGVIKQNHFKSVENSFYAKEVLCKSCKSPETKRLDKEYILCAQCGCKYQNKIRK